MKYVFYISKSMPENWTTYRRDTECRNGDSWHLPKGSEPAEQFDVPRILAKLQDDPELREKSEGRCQFRQVHIDGREVAAICVMTDYPHARAVACALGKLLYDEPEVSLYDAERDMKAISCRSDVPEGDFITARQAYRKYRAAIICKFLPQRHYAARVGYFKIDEDSAGSSLRVTASVTALEGDFKECIRRFDSILRELANALGDEVYCRNGCFFVCRKDASFRFVLEGVGKSPEWIGWMEDGEPKVHRLNRCGIWKTRKAIAKMPKGEMEHIRSRLHYSEALVADSQERNLADRFVNSYKLSKVIACHELDIVYGEHPDSPHSEVMFWLSYDGAWYYPMMDDMSTIRFGDEDKASVILDIMGEVIPSYWKHYYEDFYVRAEEVQKIQIRMKEVREIVRRNPSDPALGKLADRLMRSSFAYDCEEFSRTEDFDKARKESLFKHRHDIVALYDIFIRWMDHASVDGFWVAGP